MTRQTPYWLLVILIPGLALLCANYLLYVNYLTPTFYEAPRRKEDAKFTNTTTLQTAAHTFKQQQNSTKPWLILHIGPPKTATTTIQAALTEHSRMLTTDNYYYLGAGSNSYGNTMANNESSACVFCVMGHLDGFIAQEDQEEQIEALKVRIRYHRSQNHHVIFSAEQLGAYFYFHWDRLAELFALDDFQVRIVLTYRHLMDRAPSQYYQGHFKDAADFEPLLPFLKKQLDKMAAMTETQLDTLPFKKHYRVWKLYQKWSGQFDDVKVLNFHKEGDIATRFIFQALPTSTKTCDGMKMEQQDKTVRPSMFLHVNHIVSIIRQDMIDKREIEVKRRDRFTHDEKEVLLPMIETLLDDKLGIPMTNGTQFPESEYYECIDDSLEAQFLNLSLTSMRKMYEVQNMTVSEEDWQQAVVDHNAVYQKNKVKGKYCDIRAHKIMKDFPGVQVKIREWLWSEFASNRTAE